MTMTSATMPTTTLAGTDEALLASSALCRQITRRAARNFYHGLKLLPEPKRSRMYALYAYMRLLDDIADEDDGRSHDRRLADLAAWRELTSEVLESRLPEGTGPDIWPAFADLVHRHAIPLHIFESAIAGQRQDLVSTRFETFEQLREYCYRVAGVVGIASVYVWGYEGGQATLDLAIERGVAFQLTNILRDIQSDARGGRIYLPREDLDAAGVTDEQILQGRGGPKFVEMVRFQIARAEASYEKSADLENRISRDSRPTLGAMTEIYRGLLKKIAKDPECILRQRVSLSLLDKVLIASRAKRATWAR
ncbi:phytoene/squalene synthase family protein [Humisphaera borealis]|uniref:Phytoene/squalene synthase family protein n=1 Tax=Humisphaera borealis TaxID=2807512 RepID=A0A7M2X1T6_9BACT|nr:phytoene/squalene synthase family protein [Humisphaera borealis]QOV90700.1 phytoene/squalene synthase family protein [Humisphaera borealis]